MTRDFVGFPEIVAEIRRLHEQRATGTLSIVTRDSHSAQLILAGGEIVFIVCSSKRGQEAIALLAEIGDGRFRFTEGGIVPRPMPLPTTEAILAMLAEHRLAISLRPSAPATAPTAPPPSPAPTRQPVAGADINETQKSILERCLAECIGPMATMICEDHLNQPISLAEAMNRLTGELPSAEQAKKFRSSVAARMG
jgi:hypothetical protein